MATRRYKISPGQTEFQVVEEVGAATNSNLVELTIDLTTSGVTDNGATRTLSKEEALIAIEQITNHIVSGIWPPA